MLRVVLIVLIVCDNVFGVPMDRNNNKDFVFAKKLINVLRNSGKRITTEAKELTRDLNHVVDVFESSFIADYAGQGKDVVTTTPTIKITTITPTTEEESNAILEQTETTQESTTTFPEETTILQATTSDTLLQETEGADLEPTTQAFLETEPGNQKQRPSSAFNSLFLQKIEEVAKAMKEGRAALEFSTKWAADEEGFKSHRINKRQAAVTDSAVVQSDEMNQCISRWDLEQHKFSEKKHLDGLQRELEKMEELIEILKQQQHILDNMSDIDEKYYEFLNHSMRAGNIAEQKRLVQLLEVLNSKLTVNSTNATDVEEIVRLRSDVEQLKLAVEDLPKRSKAIESKFSKEIERQKKDIFRLKTSLWDLAKAERVALNHSIRAVDPQYIQEQIDLIQSKVDEVNAKGNHQEWPNQQNPLNDLQAEVEYLQQLVDEQQNPQLEDEEKQLLNVKKVIDDLIRSKQAQQMDFVVGGSLHQLKGSGVVTPKGAKSGKKSQPRSRDGDDTKKLIKALSSVDPQQAELQRSIVQLQRTLQAMMDKDRVERDKQKQFALIADRIKTLDNTNFQGKSITDDEEEKIIVKLLRRILQEMDKPDREFVHGDTDSELKKLAESINKLQPKDNDFPFEIESETETSALAAQFDLLNNLLEEKHAQNPFPKPPFTSQQLDFLFNQFTPQFQPPFAPPPPPTTFVDFQPNFPPQQHPIANTNNNLFRDYPKNFAPPQGGYTRLNQQPLVANPQQTYVNADAYSKQKIEDLKQQIYKLQDSVATLDDPNYIKKPEDEETIFKLEQQIANLKSVVNDLNNENGNYRNKPRVRRSVGGGSSDDDEEAGRFMEQTANFLSNFMPKEETQTQLQQRSSESLHQKLLDLEKQLGERRKLLEGNKRKSPEDYRIRTAYDALPNLETSTNLHEIAKVKKLDIFEKIITVIVDKVAIAIPIVIRKLFGITVENLADYNPNYDYGSVQSLKDLGIFGYLPLIALKFLDGFTYFISLLKKNRFMKTFLMPVLVIGGVLGFIVFLIWWMQPDDYNKYGYLNYEGDKNYGYNSYDNSRTRRISYV